MKKEFLGFNKLKDDHKKDLKLLLNEGVRLREILYSGTAKWEHYFLAEYRGIGIKFSFSDGADRSIKNHIVNDVWEDFQHQTSIKNIDE